MPTSKELKSPAGLASKIVGSVAVGLVLYLVVSVWAVRQNHGLTTFHWAWFPVLLVLSSFNYLLRFGKWQYYLGTLKVRVPRWDSFVIFMSGLALSITPSKVGEVGRSYFLKQGFGEPLAKTAPIVLADRLSDLVALVILCTAGAFSYHYGESVVWGVAVVVMGIFVVVTVRPLGHRVLGLMGRLPGLRSRVEHMETLYDSSATLLNVRRVLWPLVLSVLAWGMESFGFYLTLKGFGLQESLGAAVFIYSFSTIVGAVTMLPGGLGATEGSLAGLLKLLNVSTATAALAAILIRAATLWFGVGVGVVFLLVAQKRYGTNAGVKQWKVSKNGG
jgi:uncharacterized protein (TIRG00374 family)